MKALITGGTGFIGSRLALRARERGWTVRILGQENTATEAENRRCLTGAGIEVMTGSVTDRARVAQAVAGVDVVYHLAAAQHEAGVPDALFRDVNVAGTRLVAEASAAAGVRRLVHGSTIGVYGSSPGRVLDEDSAPRPDSIYGVTKLEAEAVVLGFRDRLSVVVVRIAETYGPGDRRLLKLFRAIQRRAFVLVGDGRNVHHPIHVDDLTEALVLAACAEPAAGQVLVLAGPEPLTTREMGEAIARQLGTPLQAWRLPAAPVIGCAIAVEAAARIVGVRPPIHRRRVDFFTKSFAFAPQRAKDVLGFIPGIGFERGAAETLAWYREHGHLARAAAAAVRAPVSAPRPIVRTVELTAKIEPFDSFWEAPDDIEKGYGSFGQFYRHNYLQHLPAERDARILAISCGYGYLVDLLVRAGYTSVLGIDSDPGKIAHAERRRLPCEAAEAFAFLHEHLDAFDAIVAEQELNHLTKDEILEFLARCRRSLRPGGTLIVHVLNGANPITGAEALAQNFDHYNTFTEYTLRQVLGHTGFVDTRVVPLNLYVFYTNPLNYVLMGVAALYALLFRFSFMLYGKTNRIFTKKIAAISRTPGA